MKALLFAVACALLVAVPALAENQPNPAVAACKAEYGQLGAAGFATKYGAGDAGYRACVVAHGGATAPARNGPPSNPALAACKAEYGQLGAAGFAAKYGQGEAGLKACVAAHGGTVPTPAPATGGDSGPVAACKAEYQQLGAAGFAAKYGQGEAALKACVVAHGGTPPPPSAGGNDAPKIDVATYLAQGLCVAEAKSLGAAAFQAKYGNGKDGLAACVKAQAAKAQSILATCKSTAGSNPDAFKQCVVAALKPGAR